MPPLRLLAAALPLLLCAPLAARAHGLSQEVERRGEAFAVRVRYEHGKPLAGATYQVLRPGATPEVVREGETPADGWVELVPDVPGVWVVKVVDRTGHGRTVRVEVGEGEVARAGEPTGAATATPSTSTTTTTSTSTTSAAGPGVAGVLVAAAGIILLFVVIRGVARRGGRG